MSDIQIEELGHEFGNKFKIFRKGVSINEIDVKTIRAIIFLNLCIQACF